MKKVSQKNLKSSKWCLSVGSKMRIDVRGNRSRLSMLNKQECSVSMPGNFSRSNISVEASVVVHLLAQDMPRIMAMKTTMIAMIIVK